MPLRIKDWQVYVLTVITALINFVVFGLSHYRTWSDAFEYSSHATNLLQSGLYSFDGTHFDVAREPGYPFFLTIVYKIFGNENLLAVGVLQALLLGVLGFIIYRTFAEYEEKKTGLTAGIVISAFPSYGYYANEILTELLFAFLMSLLFFISIRILHAKDKISTLTFFLFGVLCGYASLVRVQFLFFLPLVGLLFILFSKRRLESLKKSGAAFAALFLILGSWGLYVKQHTGHFALTEGRQESVLNVRAVRAQLSYSDLTRYAGAWVSRSIHGGVSTPILDNNEAKGITERYFARATTTEAVARIKSENMHTILSNPGHYIYGNVIEVMKMLYIEHDYTDSQSRYFRPVLYAFMYAFFLFGLFQIARNWKNKEMRIFAAVALLFPLYNLAILSFFDTVPRFNTPYLQFYIVIGFIGVVIWRRGRDHLQV